ncbi:hypothetical protein COCMIDRAFT_1220 [Bipolaris oryzae ATCC 44560]|uniref:Uncharacterized protein n=1 Tax=Bipolaris oryzae ATCC 44560 TaxID=930090 RepID=W6ZDU6_COCMI|nr:uncharacterized protein COCMIDRAFT_1220 [Bipolaris oryzae ATCC 44560]EUC50027.1 hypothetical protein COCMIDRAFT_1220 [Bipolaris oryzae ATCC 44560]
MSLPPDYSIGKKTDTGEYDSDDEASPQRGTSTPISGQLDRLPEVSNNVDTDNSPSDEEQSTDQSFNTSGDSLSHAVEDKETFEPHETDATKIKAFFHLKLADGSGYYKQRDILPEQRESAEDDENDEHGTLFVPELTAYKVPQKLKAGNNATYSPWTKASTWRWKRTADDETEFWTPRFVFRRFHARTHKYEGIYVGETRIKNIDPNNRAWVSAYNKWISQIKRRSDSSWVHEKRRDHWTVPEICAMYNGINEFLHINGIDAYHGMTNVSLRPILDAINAAGNKNRGMDALRGQLSSAHALKNASLAYLRDNVQELVKYLEDGGILDDGERFPEKFIPEDEFPTAPRRNMRKIESKNKSSGHKVKYVAGSVEVDVPGNDTLGDGT